MFLGNSCMICMYQTFLDSNLFSSIIIFFKINHSLVVLWEQTKSDEYLKSSMLLWWWLETWNIRIDKCLTFFHNKEGRQGLFKVINSVVLNIIFGCLKVSMLNLHILLDVFLFWSYLMLWASIYLPALAYTRKPLPVAPPPELENSILILLRLVRGSVGTLAFRHFNIAASI